MYKYVSSLNSMSYVIPDMHMNFCYIKCIVIKYTIQLLYLFNEY